MSLVHHISTVNAYCLGNRARFWPGGDGALPGPNPAFNTPFSCPLFNVIVKGNGGDGGHLGQVGKHPVLGVKALTFQFTFHRRGRGRDWLRVEKPPNGAGIRTWQPSAPKPNDLEAALGAGRQCPGQRSGAANILHPPNMLAAAKKASTFKQFWVCHIIEGTCSCDERRIQHQSGATSGSHQGALADKGHIPSRVLATHATPDGGKSHANRLVRRG